MIKKTSSNQACGRDSAFLQPFSIYDNNMAGVTDEVIYAEPEAIQLASSSKLAENQLDGSLFKKPPNWFSASFELVALFLQYNKSHIYMFKKPPSWFSASLERVALFLQYNKSHKYMFKKPPSWFSTSLELVDLILQYNNSHKYMFKKPPSWFSASLELVA